MNHSMQEPRTTNSEVLVHDFTVVVAPVAGHSWVFTWEEVVVSNIMLYGRTIKKEWILLNDLEWQKPIFCQEFEPAQSSASL